MGVTIATFNNISVMKSWWSTFFCVGGGGIRNTRRIQPTWGLYFRMEKLFFSYSDLDSRWGHFHFLVYMKIICTESCILWNCTYFFQQYRYIYFQQYFSYEILVVNFFLCWWRWHPEYPENTTDLRPLFSVAIWVDPAIYFVCLSSSSSWHFHFLVYMKIICTESCILWNCTYFFQQYRYIYFTNEIYLYWCIR
jgi:hypothetical protein